MGAAATARTLHAESRRAETNRPRLKMLETSWFGLDERMRVPPWRAPSVPRIRGVTQAPTRRTAACTSPILEPGVQSFIDALERRGGPPPYTLSPAAARGVLREAQKGPVVTTPLETSPPDSPCSRGPQVERSRWDGLPVLTISPWRARCAESPCVLPAPGPPGFEARLGRLGRKVSALFRTLREEGLGALVVSHDYRAVQQIADRVLASRMGRRCSSGRRRSSLRRKCLRFGSWWRQRGGASTLPSVPPIESVHWR